MRDDELLDLVRQVRFEPLHPARFGAHDVLVGKLQVGRGELTTVVKAADGLVTVVQALEDSFREDVAVALFDAAARVGGVPETAVRGYPLGVEGFALDRAVVIGPGGDRLFGARPELAARTVGVHPMHRGEFVEGEEPDAFWLAAGKAARIEPGRWDRAPRPRCEVRLLDDWPGGPMRKTRKRIPRAAEDVLTHLLPGLPRGVRLLLRDVRGIELVLAREWDRLVGTRTGPEAGVDVARSTVLATLMPLFLGGEPAPDADTPPETDVLEMTYSTTDRGYATLPLLQPLDSCVARLSAHILRAPGNFAVFTGRSGAVVQVACAADGRLWLETPDPSARRTRGRHVTLPEAEHLLRVLAREDRSAVEELGDLQTENWPEDRAGA